MTSAKQPKERTLNGRERRLGRPLIARLVTGLCLLAAFALTACDAEQAAEPLPPDQYLEQALNWIEEHSQTASEVDWPAIRAAAGALAPDPQSTAETYPAIDYALAQLNDSLAWLADPSEQAIGNLGLLAVVPGGVVVEVSAGSPAAAAGVQTGDIVEAVNGQSIHAVPGLSQLDFFGLLLESADPERLELALLRDGRLLTATVIPGEWERTAQPTSRSIALDGRTVAYLDLDWDAGAELYPTRVQETMSAADSPDNCGWVIDLRRNVGGNLWSYLAALGPIVGEGELGGFVYPDGRDKSWRYEDGRVFWDEEDRDESYVRGSIYDVATDDRPVALLISSLTHGAGELVVAAFQGRGTVRTFGQPTAGAPHLVVHTLLSDGAAIFVSGAQGRDRNGRLYSGPIVPDEAVAPAWDKIGATDDPALNAAQTWLAGQATCQQDF